MEDVLRFWFEDISPACWWTKDSAFDQRILKQFGTLHSQAVRGELCQWRTAPEGRLAEIIVIDQFSRNMFRDDPRSFLFDPIALVLAQEAVSAGVLSKLPPGFRPFLLMPYMHSESPAIHEMAVPLFELEGMEGNLNFELRHKAIIDRFGRYPHRNAILGRVSTAEEIEFLKEPGSSF